MSDEALDPATIETLLESVGGDQEFLMELFGAFIDEAPGQLAAVIAGIEGGDPEAVRHAAHTLKSTSASLGALSLSNSARSFEEAARAGTLETAPPAETLTAQVDAAIVAMQRHPAAAPDGS